MTGTEPAEQALINDSLARAMERIKETDKIVESAIGDLETDSLMELSGYRAQVHDDYATQTEDCRQNFEAPLPKYRKLEVEGVKDKAWWPKMQTLFSEQDGTVMPNDVYDALDRFIREKARLGR
jgi:hypothetical protein